MGSSPVFALSFHADYRCRHSGACCTADWDVPVELPVYQSLRAVMADDRLRLPTAVAHLDPFIIEPDLPEDVAAILQRNEAGDCVFLDRGAKLCIVHRDVGEPALPETCRHFPRLAVRDGRGTFITLTHFCPTAAAMLFRDDCPVAVVEAPEAFPPAEYEGLVIAEDDLPPLLAPSMLMEPDAYSAWERHMVARCAEIERAPESVLVTLARDAEELVAWMPVGPGLVEAVGRLPRDYIAANPPNTLGPSLRLHADAMAAVPDDMRPDPDEEGLEAAFLEHVRSAWDQFRAPLNRYLAAKAFASWTAYQGRGIATIVRGLEAALALVRVEAARQCRDAGRRLDQALLLEAFRSADFTLNHLAVGEDLAEGWERIPAADIA
jgi:Fe-S-cluster containining protein